MDVDTVKAQIFELRDQGLSMKQIADQTGYSKSTIHRVISNPDKKMKATYDPHDRAQKKKNMQEAQIAAYIKKKETEWMQVTIEKFGDEIAEQIFQICKPILEAI